MDSLIVSALKVATQIGVYAWEQRIRQNLLIDITIPMDFSDCQDTLSKTLDYDALCQAVTQLVESRSFQLIETVANEIALLIQKDFKVSSLTVAVSKAHAVKNAETVQVVVNR